MRLKSPSIKRSTRSFERVGEALGSAKGLSKTQISRVTKSFAADYQKLMDQDLAAINVTASRSWLEAFPETITCIQIADKDLRRSFSTTNGIESLFSSVRLVTGRVKRWRNSNHALYWTAGAYFRIQPNMRRVRGFKALNQLDLIRKIDNETKQQKAA